MRRVVACVRCWRRVRCAVVSRRCAHDRAASSSSSSSSTPAATRTSAAGEHIDSSNSRDDDVDDPEHWRCADEAVPRAWRDVDIDAFVSASNSEAVRSAHFGPAWSRTGFVVAASLARARTAHADRDGVPRRSDHDTHGDNNVDDNDDDVRSANEQHQRALDAQRRLLRRSYDSYEAYLAAEEAGEAGECDNDDGSSGTDDSAPPPPQQRGHDDDDDNKPMSLPPFMRDSSVRTDETSASHMPQRQHGMACATAAATTDTAAAATTSAPDDVQARFCAALGPLHGTAAVPLSDPHTWQTEHVLTLLRLVEQHVWSAHVDDNNNSNSTSTDDAVAARVVVMDATMCDAFRIARVDGHMLLYMVTPPELFRVLRRWHLQRRHALEAAWQLYRQRAAAAATTTSSSLLTRDTAVTDDDSLHATVAAAVLAPRLPQLHSTLATVTPTMVQETILQCYRYSR